MAHESRTHADAVWIPGYVVPRTDFEDLDAKAFRAVNGDTGGTHAPTTPIVLTGGLQVTGPTTVQGAGVLASATSIQLGDNEYPDLAEGHAGRLRTLLQSTIPFMTVGAVPGVVVASPKYAAAQPVALTLVDSRGAETSPEFLIPLRVHNGATLDRLTFTFRVPELRRRSPDTMPRFRVFRRDAYGHVSVLQATALADGYASPENPGSGVTWYAKGDAQTFEYVCDQNNVIDVATYVYFAHVIEETGATDYPQRLLMYSEAAVIFASTGSVDDLMPVGPRRGKAIFDGVDSGYDSAPFIYKDASYPPRPFSVLGVYNSGSNAADNWHRTIGFHTTEHLAQNNGALFFVAGGLTESDQVWQMKVAMPFVLGTSVIGFDRPDPRGNVYHSIELHFSNITTCRPQ